MRRNTIMNILDRTMRQVFSPHKSSLRCANESKVSFFKSMKMCVPIHRFQIKLFFDSMNWNTDFSTVPRNNYDLNLSGIHFIEKYDLQILFLVSVSHSIMRSNYIYDSWKSIITEYMKNRNMNQITIWEKRRS